MFLPLKVIIMFYLKCVCTTHQWSWWPSRCTHQQTFHSNKLLLYESWLPCPTSGTQATKCHVLWEGVTTGIQKSNWSKCYLYFNFQLSPWNMFYVLSVVYITSIEEFRRGIRKPAPRIKWKILIHLSVSKAVLASRRETTPVHSDATRQPSAKTP